MRRRVFLSLPLPNPAAYRIYARATPNAPGALVDEVEDDVLSYTLTGLLANSEAYYYVNTVSGCGVESTISASSRMRRVAMDGDNELIPPTPNAPTGLNLTAGEAGEVTAAWRHSNGSAEADVAGFNVYVATGEDAFDYDTQDFVIDTPATTRLSLGSFANGTTVRCVVRAKTAAGIEETNTTAATTTAVAAAPEAPSAITVS